MGFESSLNTENFKNIYNILCNTNPEGILTVSDDKRTKHIYFTSDYIYLSGDYCKDKIEKILLVAGRVNEDELEIIRNGQKKSNKILDELFLEKQLLSKEELLQIGHEQIIEEFCDFFFWENSNFSFQSEWDKSTLPTDCKAIPILHFSDLLYSIYEQMKEWEYVRRHIRSLSLIFILQEENFITSEMLNKHEMANEIQEIIQYLYGFHDISEIFQMCKISILDICHILSALIYENIIRPANFEELFENAKKCQEQGNIQKYIQLLEIALKIRPDNAQIRISLAEAYEATGRKNEAGLFYYIASEHFQISDPRTAVKYLELTLEYTPNNIDARETIVQLLENLNMNDKEVEHVQCLIKAYIQEQLYEKAFLLCQKYQERYPEKFEFTYLLIDIYAKQNLKHLVIQEYENLAQCYQRHFNMEKYLEILKKIIEIDPDRPDIIKSIQKEQKKITLKKYIPHIRIIAIVICIVLPIILYMFHYSFNANNLLYQAKNAEIESYQNLYKLSEAKDLYEQVKKNYRWSNAALKADIHLQMIHLRELKRTTGKKNIAQSIETVIQNKFNRVQLLAQIHKYQDAIQLLEKLQSEYKDQKWQKYSQKLMTEIRTQEIEYNKNQFFEKYKKAKEYHANKQWDEATNLYKELQNRTSDVQDISQANEISKHITASLLEISNNKMQEALDNCKKRFSQGEQEQKEYQYNAAVLSYKASIDFGQQALGFTELSEPNRTDIKNIISKAEFGILLIERTENEVKTIIEEAKILEKQGDIVTSFQNIQKILETPRWKHTNNAKKAKLPIQIRTNPTHIVIQDTKDITPCILYLQQDEEKNIQLEKNGYEPVTITVSTKKNPVYDISLTKKILWQYNAQGALQSPVQLYKNLLFFTNRSGKITALHEVNGKVVWENTTTRGLGDVESSVNIYDNILYVGSNDGCLYAFDTEKGNKLWKFEAKGPIKLMPSVERDCLCFGTDNGYIYTLQCKTGSILWQKYLGNKFKCASEPIIIKNNVIFISKQGDIIAYHLFSGNKIWGLRLPERIFSKVTQDNMNLYMSLRNHLACFNLDTKKITWRTRIQGNCVANVFCSKQSIYLGTTEGYVYALSRIDGSFLWRKKLSNNIQSTLWEENNYVYVGCMDGQVHILLSKNGMPYWNFQYSTKGILCDIIGTSRAIYIGTMDGILYSLEKE
ncbi:MAG: PQQ-binding-like beta-propeller repeat protein [Planctomycetes bacterium]|nr:PQQ-binding-like beta-propeller repeat protein [Planctomycetota bacterium]HPY75949.1 PQQ-binding-like beta-propeller repeat protein [Planctomycetota bacterium]HQB01498.1 PQQ-binding-like beta-propeller repeat protein [Planctomycetota bacterium]